MDDNNHNRRAEDRATSTWRLQRTISLDSVFVLLTALVSGVYFVSSVTHRQETTEIKLETVNKALEELRADFRTRDQRVEGALKDQNQLIQQLVTETAKEKAVRDLLQQYRK